MTARVRIKAGPVEFEYEGDTEFSIEDIKDLFSHIETLFTVPSLATPHGEGGEPADGTSFAASPPYNGTKLHVNSIAAKVGGSTGSQLALAAAAYLQIMDGKESFTRSQLLKTMQAATLHYKKSMSNNLSKHIATLVGDKFNQLGQDKYSLKSDAYSQLESQLAE